MFEAITKALETFIGNIGYLGVFLLMALESTMVPIPSELVMPFAGYLAGKGTFSLPIVLLMNTLGALTGSLAFYWFGSKAGKPVLLKVGKWFLVKPHDIDKTEAYFHKKGRPTVFIARFIPVVRHFISFVAGLGHMPIGNFTLQTVLGASLWGSLLAVVGYVAGENWESLSKSFKYVDWALGAIVIIGAVWLYVRWRKKRREQSTVASAAPNT